MVGLVLPHQSLSKRMPHRHFHRSPDEGILSDEGSLLSGETLASVQLTKMNQYRFLSDNPNVPTGESLQHLYAFILVCISHFHLMKLFFL